MADVALWSAVILQAIDDATMTVADPKPGASAGRLSELRNKTKARDDARRWLLEPNRDFDAVCGLAGLEPVQVRAYAVARLCTDRQSIDWTPGSNLLGCGPSQHTTEEA